jgi:hypothetical protein
MEQDDVQDRSIPAGLIQERPVEDPLFVSRGVAEVTRDLFQEINSNSPMIASLPPLNPQDFTQITVQAPAPAPPPAAAHGRNPRAQNAPENNGKKKRSRAKKPPGPQAKGGKATQ